MHLDETLSWPFFDDGHRRFAEALARWADATLPVAAPRRRRRRLPRAREGAGRGRLPQGGRAGRARRAPSPARRAHALPGAGNPGVPRRLGGFRLCHAGARHRLDLALRLGRAQGALPAAGARRQSDRGLRAVGAGGGLRRRGDGDDGEARRQFPRPHRRQQDLDLERRHRRSLRGVRAHQAKAPAPGGSRPSWSMPIRRA